VTQGKTNNKAGKTILANKDKPSTSGSTGNDTKINLTTYNENVVEKKYGHTINNLDYNVIEDMKKTKDNISMFDICSLTQQREAPTRCFQAS
jgi:hypothetical protein